MIHHDTGTGCLKELWMPSSLELLKARLNEALSSLMVVGGVPAHDREAGTS